MAEIRKDYLLDKYVIIATERAKRPDQFLEIDTIKNSSRDNGILGDNNFQDFFAPGNEYLTPSEKGRIGNPWKIRWFENKFSAVDIKESNLSVELSESNLFYTFAKAYGVHEVIVETPDDRQQWDLTEDEIKLLFDVYFLRIEDLSVLPNIKYVQVFKNHGKKAGCSIQHSHSQIIALNLVPPEVIEYEEKVLDYINNFNKNPYDDIIEREINSYRDINSSGIIMNNNSMLCFCPYASLHPMQVRIMPLRNLIKYNEFSEKEKLDLSKSISFILQKLKKLNMSYNMFLRYGIKYQRAYIDIIPRPNIWAGFEMATGIIINSVSPEEAAKFYRS